MEFRQELDLKQKLIQELTTKIQFLTENYETFNRDNAAMTEYLKIKLEDEHVKEQRKLVKLRNPKICTKCRKKFSLFKWKMHCCVCGYAHCSDCLFDEILDDFTQASSGIIHQESSRSGKICYSCLERKNKLNINIEETSKKLRT